jgi:hypothetical protein
MRIKNNPTENWVCGVCGWIHYSDEYFSGLGECPNCDSVDWLPPHSTPWTTTPPTEPGWYWAVYYGKVQILDVDYKTENHSGTEIKYLTFWESGIPTIPGHRIDLDAVDYWLGPLPVPDMPLDK